MQKNSGLFNHLAGIFVTDAGYLLKEEELEKMYASARKPVTATRKNMKRIMTKEQFRLLRNRNIIENVWSVMKLNYNLIYHRARSITGMFRHFFYREPLKTSSLSACSVRKWFIISAKADCESVF
ncbi:MAG: transposase [Treponema sp.]|uniref:transposase n=1 Tax=Treponema sp. TaxID=166 RepID=UPI003FA337D2